jgi:hypothetical protein
MISLQWSKRYLHELWKDHHAEIIMALTTDAFWAVSLRGAEKISVWGSCAVLVLVVYLAYILRDARETTNAVFGLVEIPYSIVTHKLVEEAESHLC